MQQKTRMRIKESLVTFEKKGRKKCRENNRGTYQGYVLYKARYDAYLHKTCSAAMAHTDKAEISTLSLSLSRETYRWSIRRYSSVTGLRDPFENSAFILFLLADSEIH